MVTFLSLALAVALTYVVRDLYSPHLYMILAWGVDLILVVAFYLVTNKYLKHLKE